MRTLQLPMAFALCCAFGSAGAASAFGDDVANIPSQDLRAEKDENKRYSLIGTDAAAKTPTGGSGLLVVLPGGDGGANFHPFVKRIYKNSLPDDFLNAQPVAVKWADKQQIVWPTDKLRAEGMKFTTEEFADAVIRDVGERRRVDPARVSLLAWSSSGPAAYTASLGNPKVKGSFIAMSVFKPATLPPIERAKGRSFYLFHSPDNRVCPFRMAEQAGRDLEKNGARVKLATYSAGHGWKPGMFDQIRDGVRWLETTP